MEELTIDLFEPGMSILHRAGLGGLACTLRWLDRVNGSSDKPSESSTFDDRTVTLRWKGGAEGAREFFKQLYTSAFDLKDGLIHLPGCYGMVDLKAEVRAELQQGMSQTILQFGPNRKTTSKTLKVKTYDDGNGQPMTIQHQDLNGYTHQSAWEDLFTPKGVLKPRVLISGTIAPGFAVRHNAHPASTIEQPPGLAIALHFALVGTLSLAIDRKSGVLIVPDVQDLKGFVTSRPRLNPGNARDCQVNGPADAALQAEIRLRTTEIGNKIKVERCQAVLFATKAWNDKQKTRAKVIDVAAEERDLDFFDEVMRIPELLPRIAYAKPEKKGDAPRPFYSKGVVRPLIAENLARRQPWYQDFRRLIVSADGATDEDLVRLLSYETEGLHIMINKPWQDQGEQVFVESIHEAMRGRFAAIGDETDDPVTFGNRVDRQRQKWRLKFAGAKTPDDLRAALGDLWSRSNHNPTLQAGWRTVLPLICDPDRWQLIRDLALLALSSYKKAEKPGASGDPDAKSVSKTNS